MFHAHACGGRFLCAACRQRMFRPYDTFEQFTLLDHCIAYSHAHVPRGIFVDLKIACQLTGGDALFGIEYQGNGEKPFLKGKMGVVEDRSDRGAK